MIKNFKRIIKITSILIGGSLFLYNCESDADNLGEQLFVGDAAQENVDTYDVTAYNINNNDSIRSDGSKLQFAQLGAFSESVFGTQKAAYTSQVRMQEYNPVFGGNPAVDSVVLVMKMPLSTFVSDSVTTTTSSVVYPEGSVAATKEIKSYPVVKYGNRKINGKTLFNIKVKEVSEFLNGSTDVYYSNVQFATGAEIGSKLFDGNINSGKITKTADAATLFTYDTSLRIPLSTSFFQNKIIGKEGSADLKDVTNFIRYFKGVQISVTENDGYLFPFNPNDMEILMYYKKDKMDGSTVLREQKIFKFPLGAEQNVHVAQYAYNRAGSLIANALAAINTSTGDKKLFVQGMGGPGFGFRIQPATIAALKNKLQTEKIGIISAKVRVYTDTSIWSNSYVKPQTFVFLQKDATSFLQESSTLIGAPNFILVRPYDLDKNPAYYDFTVTKTLKDVIEKEASDKDFIVQMGTFLTDANNILLGVNKSTRQYSPNRIVFVGSNPESNQRIQLRVQYGTKK